MFCQLLIRLVEDDLVLTVLLHTGFQVVTQDDPGNTTEVFVGVHKGSGLGFLVHGKESFCVAVAAVRQGGHEHIGRDNFTVICVNNGGSITGSVYLHDLSGFMI